MAQITSYYYTLKVQVVYNQCIKMLLEARSIENLLSFLYARSHVGKYHPKLTIAKVVGTFFVLIRERSEYNVDRVLHVEALRVSIPQSSKCKILMNLGHFLNYYFFFKLPLYLAMANRLCKSRMHRSEKMVIVYVQTKRRFWDKDVYLILHFFFNLLQIYARL